jgi:hypothetical protein
MGKKSVGIINYCYWYLFKNLFRGLEGNEIALSFHTLIDFYSIRPTCLSWENVKLFTKRFVLIIYALPKDFNAKVKVR